MKKRHLVPLALLLLLPRGVHQAVAARPNVVMLLSDDLGYRDLGCYEGPVNTPALDGLAAGGTRFEVFYSGCAVCSPSRATLLTGRHHIRTGIYNWVYDQTQKSYLLEREITLAELLKQSGYATAHVGKWHLGLPFEEHTNYKPTPDVHGFDYWFATANNAEPSHLNPVNFIRNGTPLGEIQGYSCQIVVDEAIDWLDNHRDDDVPFFLNVWFHEPHMRVAAPPEIVDIYRDGSTEDATDEKAAVYSATIDNTDRAVARLLEKLAQVAPVEETLIIYASDNGSYMRDRVGDLRGQKGVNWEGGLRVPGIFCWPGTILASQVQNTPAGIVDILPTVCSLLDMDPPRDRHLDGTDISPLLLGRSAKFVRAQPFFWHLQRSVPIVAIRDGDFSLVAVRDNPELSEINRLEEAWIPMIKQGGYKDYQLFNLKNDPNQTTDIAGRRPEKLEQLKQKLLRINESVMAEGHDWHLEK